MDWEEAEELALCQAPAASQSKATQGVPWAWQTDLRLQRHHTIIAS